MNKLALFFNTSQRQGLNRDTNPLKFGRTNLKTQLRNDWRIKAPAAPIYCPCSAIHVGRPRSKMTNSGFFICRLKAVLPSGGVKNFLALRTLSHS